MLINFSMLFISALVASIVYFEQEPGDELVVGLTWLICLISFIMAIVGIIKDENMFDL